MAADDDVPMRDAPPPAETPAAKPKRRFAPQLVEETTRSSAVTKKQNQDQSSPDTKPAMSADKRTTRDASVQVDDVAMADAPPPAKTIRRFAPVPIETTFDSYRVGDSNSNGSNKGRNPHGPTAELTPDPSPTTPQMPQIPLETGHQQGHPLTGAATSVSEETQTQERFQGEAQAQAQPPAPAPAPAPAAVAEKKKPRRKFAPQLIETTKRERKVGQDGPATKPTDKTDITPGTNHIYVPKPKRKPPPAGQARPSTAHGRTEKEGEGSGRFLLTPRRQTSMKPHPNTRRATRSNSYHPDLDTILSSESGNSSEENDEEPAKSTTAAPALNLGPPALPEPNHGNEAGGTWNSRNYSLRDRRESCDEEFSGYLLALAAREAHRQRELEQALSAFPNGVRPEGVEHFFVRDNSEDDTQVDEEPLRHGTSQLLRRKSTDPGWAVKEMRAHAEKLAETRAGSGRMNIDESSNKDEIESPPEDPLWTTTKRRASRDTEMSDAKRAYISDHSPEVVAKPSPAQEKPAPSGLRASPFSMPFASLRSPNEVEDRELRRMRQAASPPMLGGDLQFRLCPSPQHTRIDPNQHHQDRPSDRLEEQQRDHSGDTGLWRGYCSGKDKEHKGPELQPPPLLQTPAETAGPNDPFAAAFTASMSISEVGSPLPAQTPSTKASKPGGGIHMLSGLDERLRKEKARKEREDALVAEFDDAFVTQVYNYLSLGYPAAARPFDEELSKISGIPVEELRRHDQDLRVEKGFMRDMEMSVHHGRGSGSTAASATTAGAANSTGASSTNTNTTTTASSSGNTTRSSTGDDAARNNLNNTSNSSSSSSNKFDDDDDNDGGFRHPEDAERRAKSRPKPPRWMALKLYIREWARQHPSLNGGEDGASHLAWGVRARKGSWAF
ncbi:hypothetical protein F4780DRAFT_406842 [Xylariomycetidae sp. FL0641]|nr:hypothetical protein F4780DRAFT_406842 [Xylariomycetidae sp. FL0641]